MSRKPHEPTHQLRQQVRSLSGVGIPQEDISIIIGISEKTLRLHYRDELDEGGADANAAVVGFLRAAIDRGNVTAMIFFEKTCGGKHEILHEEISGPGGGPVETAKFSGGVLPCNGKGICPRFAEDYTPGDELLPPQI